MTAEPTDEWTRHVAELVRHAAQRLRSQTHHVVDPEDVVQSALGSFLVRRAEGELDGEENLLVQLVAFVERHCEKWNSRARRHPSISLQPTQDDRNAGLEPTAKPSLQEQRQYFDELIEYLATGLADQEREIFLLLIEGLSVAEISKRVKLVERTVRRLREKLERKLQARFDDDGTIPSA